LPQTLCAAFGCLQCEQIAGLTGLIAKWLRRFAVRECEWCFLGSAIYNRPFYIIIYLISAIKTVGAAKNARLTL
jgi:hypothetical protein